MGDVDSVVGAGIVPPASSVASDPAPRCAAGSVWIGTLEGRLVDQNDAPLAGERVGLCGSVCLGATTRSDGRFSVHANLCFPATAAYPGGGVFDVYGLGYHADVSIDFNPDHHAVEDQITLGDVRVPALFTAPSVPVPGLTDEAQHLVLQDGFSLSITPGNLSLPFEALERVSAVRVARADLPPFVERSASGLGAMYALTPAGARCTAPSAVKIPNENGLAPGTAVEIVMLGDPRVDDMVQPGTLGVVDTGHVTPDGHAVVADHGLPFLGWVGYRLPGPQLAR